MDPAPFSGNWHLEATAQHLEAVCFGLQPRLLINFPPRFSKSLLVAVAWPAWVWAQARDPEFPLLGPAVQFLFASYSQTLSERDSLKMRRLIESPWYQERWGKTVQIRQDKDTVRKFETTSGGYRLATSVGGSLTGEGGSILVVDDPINAKESNYETIRDAANVWYSEAMSTRLNDPVSGAKVVIMQRLHEDDLSGYILDKSGEDWSHLCIPMEFDGAWRAPTAIGWTDPRAETGEVLLWPERFPQEVVDRLKRELGPFASAGQLQQSPSPKGGGIIMREWWQMWPAPGYEPQIGETLTYPLCSFIVGSVDTAYGEGDEDAWNAMTVLGVWHDQRERPKVVLMEGWRARLPLRGVIPSECKTDEERRPYWGLAEKIADTIRRRKLDAIIIENKTRAKDLAAELRRLLRDGECSIIMFNPKGDKIARLHACQPMFADGMVFAPEKAWAETIITEVSQFPKSKWKDYTDTLSQSLIWLRANGLLSLGTEADSDNARANAFRPQPVGNPYGV